MNLIVVVAPREIEICDEDATLCGFGCSGHFSESMHFCGYFEDVLGERLPEGSPGPYKRCEACLAAAVLETLPPGKSEAEQDEADMIALADRNRDDVAKHVANYNRFREHLYKSLGHRPEYRDIERVFMAVAMQYSTGFGDATVIVDSSHPEILVVTAVDMLDRAIHAAQFQVMPAPPNPLAPRELQWPPGSCRICGKPDAGYLFESYRVCGSRECWAAIDPSAVDGGGKPC